jgi:hypothetical protein
LGEFLCDAGQAIFAAEVNVVAVTGMGSPHAVPAAAAVAQKGSPLPAMVPLVVVLLAAGGLLLYGLASRRSRLAHRSQPRGRESILPAARSLLFPPSHHEALHDPAYLERILQAELGDQHLAGQSPDAAEAGSGDDRRDAVGRGVGRG